MIRKFFIGLPSSMKLMLSILIIVLLFVSCFFVSILIAIPLFDLDIQNLGHAMSVDGNLKFLKYLQVIQGFTLFIIPSFIVAYIFAQKPIKFLGLKNSSKITFFLFAGLLVIVAMPLINSLAQINSEIVLPDFLSNTEVWIKNTEENARILTEKLLTVNTLGGLFFNIFMIAVLPAIGEELLFRGIIQKYLEQTFKNVHVAIIIASIIFSAFHMQFYGFIPRLILGMILGYMYYWSKSLWVPIFAHFTNNAIAVVLFFYISKGKINENIETIGTSKQTIIYAIISFVLVTFVMFWLFKNRDRTE